MYHEFIIPHIIKLKMLSRHELIVNSEQNAFVIELYSKKNQKESLIFETKNEALEAYNSLTEAIKAKNEFGIIEVDFDII